MPTIIIHANTAHDDPLRVTFVERAVPVRLHDSHYLGQLVERLSWALLDAERLEADEREQHISLQRGEAVLDHAGDQIEMLDLRRQRG